MAFTSRSLGWQLGHEVTGINRERFRDAQDVSQGRVDLAALDLPDVGPVEFGVLRKALLTEPEGLAVCADAFAELSGRGGQGRFGRGRHAPTSPVSTRSIQSQNV